MINVQGFSTFCCRFIPVSDLEKRELVRYNHLCTFGVLIRKAAGSATFRSN